MKLERAALVVAVIALVTAGWYASALHRLQARLDWISNRQRPEHLQGARPLEDLSDVDDVGACFARCEGLGHPCQGVVGLTIGEHLLRHDVDTAFDDLHRQVYGQSAPKEEAEIVTFRLQAEIDLPRLQLPKLSSGDERAERSIDGLDDPEWVLELVHYY